MGESLFDEDEVLEFLEAQPHGGALRRREVVANPSTIERCKEQDDRLARALLENPGLAGWPPTLPLEIALRVDSNKNLCEHYDIPREQWDEISKNPAFVAEVANAIEALRKDGAHFKFRAQLQSMGLLERSWEMIHDTTGRVPPSVQADLLKFTIKAAGYDASKEAAALGGANGNTFAIQINLGT